MTDEEAADGAANRGHRRGDHRPARVRLAPAEPRPPARARPADHPRRPRRAGRAADRGARLQPEPAAPGRLHRREPRVRAADPRGRDAATFLGNEFDDRRPRGRAADPGRPRGRSGDPATRGARRGAPDLRRARRSSRSTRAGETLRATANPITLRRDDEGRRGWLLSAQVQAYALALTIALLCILVAAAGIAAERDENVLGRLTRGLVGLGELVAEKIVLVALVGRGARPRARARARGGDRARGLDLVRLVGAGAAPRRRARARGRGVRSLRRPARGARARDADGGARRGPRRASRSCCSACSRRSRSARPPGSRTPSPSRTPCGSSSRRSTTPSPWGTIGREAAWLVGLTPGLRRARPARHAALARLGRPPRLAASQRCCEGRRNRQEGATWLPGSRSSTASTASGSSTSR